ncbi:MAG: AAA family ATPase [Rubripirellula sp.]
MHGNLRFYIWMLLIGGGAAAVVATLIFTTDAKALLAGVAVLATWIAWAAYSSWLFGLRRLVASHMGRSSAQLTYVTKDVGASRAADFIRTFEELRSAAATPRHGIAKECLLSEIKVRDLEREVVDWQNVEAEDEKLISLPSNAVYFFQQDGNPFVVRASSGRTHEYYEHEDAWTTGAGQHVEICARSLEEANEVLCWLSAKTNEHSIYRGKMIQVATPMDGSPGQTIRIVSRATADRDSIVLPDAILELIDRLQALRSRYGEKLHGFGHKTKQGLLLHGPPGTGKSLLTKYLIARNSEHTVIVPTDMEVQTLRECFRIALYLQPSMVVIEDVDLLAPRRESGSRVDGLQELLNEMDGLGPSSDIFVVLSTNRPEILEPALATRPGRVSQAIEIPLPDVALREALIRMYLNRATSGQTLISEWAKRTQGASPAFLEELCRRAILLACERSDTEIDVLYGDLERAIHELVVMGGDLTARALGFPQEV